MGMGSFAAGGQGGKPGAALGGFKRREKGNADAELAAIQPGVSGGVGCRTSKQAPLGFWCGMRNGGEIGGKQMVG